MTWALTGPPGVLMWLHLESELYRGELLKARPHLLPPWLLLPGRGLAKTWARGWRMKVMTCPPHMSVAHTVLF